MQGVEPEVVEFEARPAVRREFVAVCACAHVRVGRGLEAKVLTATGVVLLHPSAHAIPWSGKDLWQALLQYSFYLSTHLFIYSPAPSSIRSTLYLSSQHSIHPTIPYLATYLSFHHPANYTSTIPHHTTPHHTTSHSTTPHPPHHTIPYPTHHTTPH